MNRDMLMSMLGAMHAQASALQQQIEGLMRIVVGDDAAKCDHPEESRDYQNGMSGDYLCGQCGFNHIELPFIQEVTGD